MIGAASIAHNNAIDAKKPAADVGVHSLTSLARNHHITGDIGADATRFLIQHGCARTAAHVTDVAWEAANLARRFGLTEEKAALAGWLHDISAVIPNAERIQAARAMGIDVLPEEERFPMIVHQKLSVPIARDLFGVTDPAVLSAIGCHTTLKANPSTLDTVLFVADKITWDQPGTPPYLQDLTAALDVSLDAAALAYIDYLWQRRDQLQVIHPWLIEARSSLKNREKGFDGPQ